MNIMPGTDYLKGKKVLLRCDFDVPVSADGVIQEVFRIQKQKPMVDYLVKGGAVTVMAAHISDEDTGSFNDLIPQLRKILGHEIKYFDALNDLEGLKRLEPGSLGIFHKLRDYKEEIKNDKKFAKKLSEGFDIYINNAFAACHRNHASVSAITEFLPSYAGFLVEDEVRELKKVMDAPRDGKLVIIGGAKAETKVPVIKNFADKAEKVIVGGIVANDILKEKGLDIGDSIADKNTKELLAGMDLNNNRLILPEDFNISDNKFFDIGPKSIAKYRDLIKNAKIIIWNGPLGMFEDPRFNSGTNSMAQAIADSGAFKVIGGGDTITAVNKLGLLDKFDFVSTGGGAMLAFLAGQKLPGLEALGYYG